MMQVVGVCTDSHVTVRTMLMNSASLKVAILTLLKPSMIILSLKGIKFPIICDRDGDFSRAFGVLKISYDKMKNSSERKFGAARAVFFCFFRILFFSFPSQVAVLDPEKRLVHLSLRSQITRARFSTQMCV